jgi:hypothetical protein
LIDIFAKDIDDDDDDQEEDAAADGDNDEDEEDDEEGAQQDEKVDAPPQGNHSDSEDDLDDSSESRVLRMLIKAKREALFQAQARTRELRAGSLKLIEQMKDRERSVLSNVKTGLIEHESFEGDLQRLGKGFQQECQEARIQLAARRKVNDGHLNALRQQLDGIEAQAQSSAEDIRQTMLFKEQGQFYNAKHLAAVQSRMAELQARHETELGVLVALSETGRERRALEFEGYFDRLKLAKAEVTCA